MQAAVLAQPLDEALALERHPENKVPTLIRWLGVGVAGRWQGIEFKG